MYLRSLSLKSHTTHVRLNQGINIKNQNEKNCNNSPSTLIQLEKGSLNFNPIVRIVPPS